MKHNEIDLERWDQCVAAATNRSIFNYSWYLNAVAENWSGLVLDDYEAVMPLPFKDKLGAKILYQPFFSRQVGVFSPRELKSEEKQEFVQRITEKYKLIQIGIDLELKEHLQEFEVERYPFQVLDLTKGYDAIQAGYSQNARRMVRKAEKSGIVVCELADYPAIVRLFRETKGDQLGQFSEEDYVHLNTLMQACELNHCGRALGAYNDAGVLLATGFFMLEEHRITYLKGAVNEDGRKQGAMYLIFDEVFKQHTGDKSIFDFGGSRNEGVASFYKKFGAVDNYYLFAVRDELPAPHRLMRKIKHLFS